MNMRNIIFCLVMLGLFVSCNESASEKASQNSRVEVNALKTAISSPPATQSSAPIADYWQQGKAELNHYELIQNRYRDLHNGEVVLVFVREDFLYEKQVKNDYYLNPNSTPILKTNKLLRFPTGLYDYSLMTSVFTPFDAQAFPQTLKVSHTAQDWCGQGYLQMNRAGNAYKLYKN